MPADYQNIGQVVVMLVLLAGSAFFSGSETAFFNLTGRQAENLRKSKHRLHNLTAKLLAKPKQLLGALLLGNMTVNILFYAASSVLIIRIENRFGITAAGITACLTFGVLVLFGEILPKSIAFANSKKFSTAAALPAIFFIRLFNPVVVIFRFFVIEPALRLILGPAKHAMPITPAEFMSLIEATRKRGLITAGENKLLTEIIELGFLKVRHCLKHRIDMIACDVTRSSQYMCRLMQENRLTKLPVFVNKIDNIIGIVSLRGLLTNPDSTPDKLVWPANFVPEQKTIESLIDFFRNTGTDTAIVVDEYGGIAGSISLEDIAEELLGPIEAQEGPELIEKTGPFEFRLPGDLPVHDWADAFGLNPAETKVSTIAGLVTAALGRIPRPGDVARVKNLSFKVEKMKRHRIETLILTLEPLQEEAENPNNAD